MTTHFSEKPLQTNGGGSSIWEKPLREPNIIGPNGSSSTYTPLDTIPPPPTPYARYKDTVVFTSEQIDDETQRLQLVKSLHAHYQRTAGGRKLLYVHTSPLDVSECRNNTSHSHNSQRVADPDGPDFNFCLLQPGTAAGTHGCSRASLLLRGVKVSRFSPYRSSSYGSLHLSIPPHIQSLFKLLGEAFQVGPVPSVDLKDVKVRCELSSSGYPKWLTKEIYLGPPETHIHYNSLSRKEHTPVTSTSLHTCKERSSLGTPKLMIVSQNGISNLPVSSNIVPSDQVHDDNSMSTSSYHVVKLDPSQFENKELLSRLIHPVDVTENEPPGLSQHSNKGDLLFQTSVKVEKDDNDDDDSFTSAVKWKLVAGKRGKKKYDEVQQKTTHDLSMISSTRHHHVLFPQEMNSLNGIIETSSKIIDFRSHQTLPVDLKLIRDSNQTNYYEPHMISKDCFFEQNDENVFFNSGRRICQSQQYNVLSQTCIDVIRCLSVESDIFSQIKPRCIPGVTEVDALIHLGNVCPYQNSNSLILFLLELHLIRFIQDHHCQNPYSLTSISSPFIKNPSFSHYNDSSNKYSTIVSSNPFTVLSNKQRSSSECEMSSMIPSLHSSNMSHSSVISENHPTMTTTTLLDTTESNRHTGSHSFNPSDIEMSVNHSLFRLSTMSVLSNIDDTTVSTLNPQQIEPVLPEDTFHSSTHHNKDNSTLSTSALLNSPPPAFPPPPSSPPIYNTTSKIIAIQSPSSCLSHYPPSHISNDIVSFIDKKKNRCDTHTTYPLIIEESTSLTDTQYNSNHSFITPPIIHDHLNHIDPNNNKDVLPMTINPPSIHWTTTTSNLTHQSLHRIEPSYISSHLNIQKQIKTDMSDDHTYTSIHDQTEQSNIQSPENHDIIHISSTSGLTPHDHPISDVSSSSSHMSPSLFIKQHHLLSSPQHSEHCLLPDQDTLHTTLSTDPISIHFLKEGVQHDAGSLSCHHDKSQHLSSFVTSCPLQHNTISESSINGISHTPQPCSSNLVHLSNDIIKQEDMSNYSLSSVTDHDIKQHHLCVTTDDNSQLTDLHNQQQCVSSHTDLSYHSSHYSLSQQHPVDHNQSMNSQTNDLGIQTNLIQPRHVTYQHPASLTLCVPDVMNAIEQSQEHLCQPMIRRHHHSLLLGPSPTENTSRLSESTVLCHLTEDHPFFYPNEFNQQTSVYNIPQTHTDNSTRCHPYELEEHACYSRHLFDNTINTEQCHQWYLYRTDMPGKISKEDFPDLETSALVSHSKLNGGRQQRDRQSSTHLNNYFIEDQTTTSSHYLWDHHPITSSGLLESYHPHDDHTHQFIYGKHPLLYSQPHHISSYRQIKSIESPPYFEINKQQITTSLLHETFQKHQHQHLSESFYTPPVSQSNKSSEGKEFQIGTSTACGTSCHHSLLNHHHHLYPPQSSSSYSIDQSLDLAASHDMVVHESYHDPLLSDPLITQQMSLRCSFERQCLPCHITDDLHPHNVKKRLLEKKQIITAKATTTETTLLDMSDHYLSSDSPIDAGHHDIKHQQLASSCIKVSTEQDNENENDDNENENDDNEEEEDIVIPTRSHHDDITCIKKDPNSMSLHQDVIYNVEANHIIQQQLLQLNKTTLPHLLDTSTSHSSRLTEPLPMLSIQQTLINHFLEDELLDDKDLQDSCDDYQCSIGDFVEIGKLEGRKDVIENQKAEIISIGVSTSNIPCVTVSLCRGDGRRYQNQRNAIREEIPISCLRLLEKAEYRLDSYTKTQQIQSSCIDAKSAVLQYPMTTDGTSSTTVTGSIRHYSPSDHIEMNLMSSIQQDIPVLSLNESSPLINVLHTLHYENSTKQLQDHHSLSKQLSHNHRTSQHHLVSTPFTLQPPHTTDGVLCFFWDLEATGLHIGEDDITQIACVCRRFYFTSSIQESTDLIKTQHYIYHHSKQTNSDMSVPDCDNDIQFDYLSRDYIVDNSDTTSLSIHQPTTHQTEELIGCWEVVSGVPDAEFNCYVYTDRIIPDAVVELTGITNAFLTKHGKSFHHALADWTEWVLSVKQHYANCPVWFVAHNGNRYDLPLLFHQEYHKLRQVPGTFLNSVGAVGIVDTVILSRRLPWGAGMNRRSHKLQSLYYDVFRKQMPNEHDALGDVTGLAALMSKEPFLSAWCHCSVGWSLTEYLLWSDIRYHYFYPLSERTNQLTQQTIETTPNDDSVNSPEMSQDTTTHNTKPTMCHIPSRSQFSIKHHDDTSAHPFSSLGQSTQLSKETSQDTNGCYTSRLQHDYDTSSCYKLDNDQKMKHQSIPYSKQAYVIESHSLIKAHQQQQHYDTTHVSHLPPHQCINDHSLNEISGELLASSQLNIVSGHQSLNDSYYLQLKKDVPYNRQQLTEHTQVVYSSPSSDSQHYNDSSSILPVQNETQHTVSMYQQTPSSAILLPPPPPVAPPVLNDLDLGHEYPQSKTSSQHSSKHLFNDSIESFMDHIPTHSTLLSPPLPQEDHDSLDKSSSSSSSSHAFISDFTDEHILQTTHLCITKELMPLSVSLSSNSPHVVTGHHRVDSYHPIACREEHSINPNDSISSTALSDHCIDQMESIHLPPLHDDLIILRQSPRLSLPPSCPIPKPSSYLNYDTCIDDSPLTSNECLSQHHTRTSDKIVSSSLFLSFNKQQPTAPSSLIDSVPPFQSLHSNTDNNPTEDILTQNVSQLQQPPLDQDPTYISPFIDETLQGLSNEIIVTHDDKQHHTHHFPFLSDKSLDQSSSIIEFHQSLYSENEQRTISQQIPSSSCVLSSDMSKLFKQPSHLAFHLSEHPDSTEDGIDLSDSNHIKEHHTLTFSTCVDDQLCENLSDPLLHTTQQSGIDASTDVLLLSSSPILSSNVNSMIRHVKQQDVDHLAIDVSASPLPHFTSHKKGELSLMSVESRLQQESSTSSSYTQSMSPRINDLNSQLEEIILHDKGEQENDGVVVVSYKPLFNLQHSCHFPPPPPPLLLSHSMNNDHTHLHHDSACTSLSPPPPPPPLFKQQSVWVQQTTPSLSLKHSGTNYLRSLQHSQQQSSYEPHIVPQDQTLQNHHVSRLGTSYSHTTSSLSDPILKKPQAKHIMKRAILPIQTTMSPPSCPLYSSMIRSSDNIHESQTQCISFKHTETSVVDVSRIQEPSSSSPLSSSLDMISQQCNQDHSIVNSSSSSMDIISSCQQTQDDLSNKERNHIQDKNVCISSETCTGASSSSHSLLYSGNVSVKDVGRNSLHMIPSQYHSQNVSQPFEPLITMEPSSSSSDRQIGLKPIPLVSTQHPAGLTPTTGHIIKQHHYTSERMISGIGGQQYSNHPTDSSSHLFPSHLYGTKQQRDSGSRSTIMNSQETLVNSSSQTNYNLIPKDSSGQHVHYGINQRLLRQGYKDDIIQNKSNHVISNYNHHHYHHHTNYHHSRRGIQSSSIGGGGGGGNSMIKNVKILKRVPPSGGEKSDGKAQLAAAIAGVAYDVPSITQLNAVASEVYKQKHAAAAAAAAAATGNSSTYQHNGLISGIVEKHIETTTHRLGNGILKPSSISSRRESNGRGPVTFARAVNSRTTTSGPATNRWRSR